MLSLIPALLNFGGNHVNLFLPKRKHATPISGPGFTQIYPMHNPEDFPIKIRAV